MNATSAAPREASLIMLDLIRAYNESGERSTVHLLSDTQIWDLGGSGQRGPGATSATFSIAYKRITAEQDQAEEPDAASPGSAGASPE